MPTIVTELPNSMSGEDSALPRRWTKQIVSDEASTARNFIEGETGKKHWIEKIGVTMLSGGTTWFRIMDGTSSLVGPIVPAEGVMWPYEFIRNIHGTAGAPLAIKTSDDVGIHAIIEGHTDVMLGKASNPAPDDLATGIPLSPTLSWTSSPQAIASTVYFGTSNPPPLVVSNTTNGYYVPGTLEPSTMYHWRVDDTDGENVAQGDIWSFTTA